MVAWLSSIAARETTLLRPPRPAQRPPPEPAAGLPVLLSPGLAELAPGLAQILGPEFEVSTEHVGQCRVLMTGPVGLAGVAFLRASYPSTGLLVVDRRWPGRRPGEAVIVLDAGADGYLCSPSLA
jgi:hypothetical protein